MPITKKPYNIWEFYYECWETNEVLKKYLDLFKSINCDELFICPKSYFDIGFLFGDVLDERFKRLKEIVPVIKQAGIVPSFELDTTIGRGTLPHPFKRLVNSSGKEIYGNGISENKACPLDENLKSYLKKYFQKAADCGIERMLIDDDFYLRADTCCCNEHISKFNKKYGVKFNRKQIRDILLNNHRKGEKESIIKRKWLRFQRDILFELAKSLVKIVQDVNPNISIGLCATSPEYFSTTGTGIKEMVKVFDGTKKSFVRLAGGFYREEAMTLIYKYLWHEMQKNLLDGKYEIFNELTSWPGNRLHKSTQMHTLDMALSYVFGINRLLFVNLEYTEYEYYISAMKKKQNFFDALCKNIPEDAQIKAVSVLTNKKEMEYTSSRLSFISTKVARDLARLGIPVKLTETYNIKKEAGPFILVGQTYNCMTKGEFREALQKGILLDAQTFLNIEPKLRKLLFKLEVEGKCKNQKGERFNNHFVNQGLTKNESLMYFLSLQEVLKIKILDKQTIPVAKIINYNKKEIADSIFLRKEEKACSCVLPYNFQISLERKIQMRNILEWLRKRKLPVYAHSTADVQTIFLDAGKKKIIVLINHGCDEAKNFLLEIGQISSKEIEVSYLNEDGEIVRINMLKKNKEGTFHLYISEALCIKPHWLEVLLLKQFS